MDFEKPWLSYEEQLTRVEERGMIVIDRDKALNHLAQIGYYRLSGYWHTFKKFKPIREADNKFQITDEFVSNTHFSDAVKLYLFDKKLRLLILDALERIEVALRVDLAYLLGKKNPFAHSDIESFHKSFVRKKTRNGKNSFEYWEDKYSALVKRSKEDFVKHHIEKYDGKLPIWVAVEVFDFGAISQVLGMMKISDQQNIADNFLLDWQVFSSWIYSLSYLRNIVAHHGRLWNKNITTQPKLPRNTNLIWLEGIQSGDQFLNKPFILLAITHYFMKKICPNSEWNKRLEEHFNEFPEIKSDRKVGLKQMGIIENWRDWW